MSDSWALKEVISSKYNRSGSGRCTNRSVLFVIENQRTNETSIFYINRVNKMSVSLSCNQWSCNHRLSMKHFLPTEQYGKKMNFKFADAVTKERYSVRFSILKRHFCPMIDREIHFLKIFKLLNWAYEKVIRCIEFEFIRRFECCKNLSNRLRLTIRNVLLNRFNTLSIIKLELHFPSIIRFHF